jgi:quinol monooxygenase YgiN
MAAEKSNPTSIMPATVAVLGTLRFPADRMQEVLPYLKALVDATYQYDGCIAYHVAQDLFDLGLIRFSELWPDHVSLARHLQAPHLQPWRMAAQRCGLIEREFTAYDVSGSQAV